MCVSSAWTVDNSTGRFSSDNMVVTYKDYVAGNTVCKSYRAGYDYYCYTSCGKAPNDM